MNKGKEGKKFVYPESFMNALSHARVYFGLPFRQTQGMVKSYATHNTGHSRLLYNTKDELHNYKQNPTLNSFQFLILWNCDEFLHPPYLEINNSINNLTNTIISA